jgi:poly(A) polymerase
MKFYINGGFVRDELLGVESKDVDYTVVGGETFEELEKYLEDQGFKIFQKSLEHYTIRAGVPKGHLLQQQTKTADFVWARKDGPVGDGRRPLWVKPGSLLDDMLRRDFTVNALAKCPDTGEIIDYVGGVEDLEHGILRFVGDPEQRIDEDGLRVVRAWRFQITKGLVPTAETRDALVSTLAETRLRGVSINRIWEELDKMFKYDPLKSLDLIIGLGPRIRRAIFRDGLKLIPSLKG